MFNNTAIKKVIIARNNKDLAFFLTNFRSKNEHKTIGFIPTMGALHNGHMSLIKEAKAHCEFVVCSLFVNPTQFNDSKDLDKYPRTEKEDLTLLELNNCDLVFIPSESDIYPKKIKDYSINFNGLDKVMEGKYRDGHFNGVCMVVERFFNLIEPNFAFFGRKDFQQVAIIKHMVNVKHLEITIISCSIKREDSGLAMSSRNSLLSDKEKENALILNQTLKSGLDFHQKGKGYEEVYKKMLSVFDSGFLKLEYLEIVNNDSLETVQKIDKNSSVCIAAYCGSVRLIDNCPF